MPSVTGGDQFDPGYGHPSDRVERPMRVRGGLPAEASPAPLAERLESAAERLRRGGDIAREIARTEEIKAEVGSCAAHLVFVGDGEERDRVRLSDDEVRAVLDARIDKLKGEFEGLGL